MTGERETTGIRIGIGGWSFEPWRETFYPDGVKRADELRWAATQLDAIEINATFYRTQTERTFRAWRDAVPEGFCFTVKAPRAATYTSDPAKQEASVERFLGSGVTALGPALGAVLWQFAPTRRFDAEALARFLALLPAERDGVRLRHAIELRHATARDPALASLLAGHGVALALVARPGETPAIATSAPFAYVRIEETADDHETGLDAAGLARWSARLLTLAEGRVPDDLAVGLIGPAAPPRETPVFAFVIAGAKRRNPAAAMALAAAVGWRG